MDSRNYYKYEKEKGNPILTNILEIAIGSNPRNLLDFEVNKEELK